MGYISYPQTDQFALSFIFFPVNFKLCVLTIRVGHEDPINLIRNPQAAWYSKCCMKIISRQNSMWSTKDFLSSSNSPALTLLEIEICLNLPHQQISFMLHCGYGWFASRYVCQRLYSYLHSSCSQSGLSLTGFHHLPRVARLPTLSLLLDASLGISVQFRLPAEAHSGGS